MRFDYYDSLSTRDQVVYDTSDRIPEVKLPADPDLMAAVDAVREALGEEKLPAVQWAMTRLSRLICTALGVAFSTVITRFGRRKISPSFGILPILLIRKPPSVS